MTKYVVNCWLVANLMHPFFAVLLVLILDGGSQFMELFFVLGLLLAWYCVSVVFCLPSLLIGCWVMGKIEKSRRRVTHKFYLWLASLPFIIMINYLAILVLLGQLPHSPDEYLVFLLCIVPALISTILASFLNFRQFNNYFNRKETNDIVSGATDTINQKMIGL